MAIEVPPPAHCQAAVPPPRPPGATPLAPRKQTEAPPPALEPKRGGAAALRNGFQPSFSEVFLEYGARRRVRFRPGTDCPPALLDAGRRHFDADGVLKPEAFGRFE